MGLVKIQINSTVILFGERILRIYCNNLGQAPIMDFQKEIIMLTNLTNID